MSGNFDKLNKQIASFIIVSAALSTPVSAENVLLSDNNLIADASINMPAQFGRSEIIAMYAAPQMPIISEPIVVHPVVKYAAPQFPIEPIQPPPAISMYAAPQHPIIIEPTPIPAPIVKYAAPQFIEKIDIKKGSPALNESSLNLNNVNPVKLPANVNSAVNIKQSAGNIRTQDFVLTDYGNVRIIEPFSHIIFK